METTSLSLVLPSSEGLPSSQGASHRLPTVDEAERTCARLANGRVRVWSELHDLTDRPAFGRALLRLSASKPSLAPVECVRRAALEAFEGADLAEWQRLDARFHELTCSLVAARADVDFLSPCPEGVR